MMSRIDVPMRSRYHENKQWQDGWCFLASALILDQEVLRCPRLAQIKSKSPHPKCGIFKHRRDFEGPVCDVKNMSQRYMMVLEKNRVRNQEVPRRPGDLYLSGLVRCRHATLSNSLNLPTSRSRTSSSVILGNTSRNM
jgi:hypothetical protein